MAKKRRTPARDKKTGRFLTKRQRAARRRSAPKKKRRPARKQRRRNAPAAKKTRTRRKTVAKRRTPPRDRKGRFRKGGRGTSSKRRRRRRNPPVSGLMARVTDGLSEGFAVLAGEGATRIAPTLLRLPQVGASGLAVQLATALVVGMGTEALGLRGGWARAATAGAFSVPLKSATLMYLAPSAPMLSAAFVPTLQAYPRRLGRMGAYSRPALPAAGNGRLSAGYPYGAGYQSPGMGNYDYAAGIM